MENWKFTHHPENGYRIGIQKSVGEGKGGKVVKYTWFRLPEDNMEYCVDELNALGVSDGTRVAALASRRRPCLTKADREALPPPKKRSKTEATTKGLPTLAYASFTQVAVSIPVETTKNVDDPNRKKTWTELKPT